MSLIVRKSDSMKVISGKYKGRNLQGFDIVGTRPTMDRVKESLFAMIQTWLNDAVVLDLFAGSGNLGIEALSQGAKYAYLVDKNRKAYRVIQNNISNLGVCDVSVYCMDYRRALNEFSDAGLTFDIIFLDPPYQTDFVAKSIIDIMDFHLLSSSGIIVAESDKLEKIIYPSTLEIVKSKKYGDKWVAILRRV